LLNFSLFGESRLAYFGVFLIYRAVERIDNTGSQRPFFKLCLFLQAPSTTAIGDNAIGIGSDQRRNNANYNRYFAPQSH
jgi:hypothetical protein